MRYFILFYTWTSKTNHGLGECTMESLKYPNKKDSLDYILNSIFEDFKLPHPATVVFTNILELNKEDYEQWIAE